MDGGGRGGVQLQGKVPLEGKGWMRNDEHAKESSKGWDGEDVWRWNHIEDSRNIG